MLIKTGSIQLKINQANLMGYKIVLPKNALIEKYLIVTSSIREKLINNLEENQKLTELRDWLLPMLMNGQVTIHNTEKSA